MSPPDVILHMYFESPFAQKVAWALQYKKVNFKIVLISRIEPRPLRRPLDAGYRKTPVLQIGNHTYCDSKVIFAELEKRYPEPSFYPAGPEDAPTETLALALSRWTDSTLFQAVISQLPFGALGEDFLNDRAQFSGRKLNPDSIASAAPYMLQSLKAELNIAENFVRERNQNNSLWALGTNALSLADLHIAMIVWFLKNFVGGDWLKENVPVLANHLKKTLAAVRYQDLQKVDQIPAEEALKLAKEQSHDLSHATHDGSLDIGLGQLVMVMPTDTGMVPSIGVLASSTINETVISHKEKEYGFTSFTHFPVHGFVVLPQTPKL